MTELKSPALIKVPVSVQRRNTELARQQLLDHIRQVFKPLSPIWLKIGKDRFFYAELLEDGSDLKINPTSGSGDGRKIYKDKCFDSDWFVKQCEVRDGGSLYLPGQPKELHTKDYVSESNDIWVEIDSDTKEEQLDRYKWFEELSGLDLLMLFSGSKSVHGHIILKENLPSQEILSLAQILCLILQGDPIPASNIVQPMRVAGSFRKDKGNYQELKKIGTKHTLGEVRAGLIKVFDTFDWNTSILKSERIILSKERWKLLTNVIVDESILPEKRTKQIREILEKKEDELFPKRASKPKLEIDSTISSSAIPPLDYFPSKENKERLNGVTSGRNKAMYALACELIADQQWLRENDITHSQDAHSLYLRACERCHQDDWEKEERDKIWDSASQGKQTPAIGDEGMRERLHLFRGSNDPEYQAKVRAKNNWKEPQKNYGYLGFFKTAKIPITYLDPDTGEEMTEQDEDGNIKYEKKRIFDSKTDFDIEILDILEDDDNGGALKLNIKQVGHQAKVMLLKSSELTKITDFKLAINKGSRSVLTCNLSIEEVTNLIQVRKEEYYSQGGEHHKLAPCRGKQDNGYWVFENIQFDKNGNTCTAKDSGIVFNPTYGDGDAIPSPQISLEQDDEKLGTILKLLKDYMGLTQFLPTLFVIAGQVAGLYYSEIMKTNDGFPIVNATGDPNCGKTFATKISRALVGLTNDSGAYSKFSKSMMYELLKRLGGINITIDDPVKDPEAEEDLKDLYNGIPRIVRGNEQKPRSSAIIASNHGIGSHSNAVKTRVASIPFFKSEAAQGNPDLRPQVADSLSGASGAFSTLLKFGYDQKAVNKLHYELRNYTQSTDDRISNSYGLLTYFALKLAPFAGLSENEIFDYVINILCQSANQGETKKDSLDDFLEKLKILASKDLIGEWDYRERVITKKMVGTCFILDSVWIPFSREFGKTVAYDKKTILDLMVKTSNGHPRGEKSRQRFAASQALFFDWKKKRQSSEPLKKEFESEIKRCLIIYTPAEEELHEDDHEESPIPIPQSIPIPTTQGKTYKKISDVQNAGTGTELIGQLVRYKSQDGSNWFYRVVKTETPTTTSKYSFVTWCVEIDSTDTKEYQFSPDDLELVA